MIFDQINPDPFEHQYDDTDVAIGMPTRVLLFNDEDHTFEEVINQIVLATHCSYPTAEQLTYEVHYSGKAQVFQGSMSESLRVSSVLESIELNTTIEC